MGAWYRTGTVTVVNGSKNVVGVGSLWLTQASSGDLFTLDGVNIYEIDVITNDTNIVLKTNYLQVGAGGQTYSIICNFTSTTNATLAAKLALMLSKWHNREDEWYTWQNGTATGGVNHDGKYPFTDISGDVIYVGCPALMAKVADIVPIPVAENDFMVGAPSPFGSWVKKTIDEIKTILGLGTAAYTAATAYDSAGTAAGKISASISDGDTTHAPDGNSVFDALALKAPVINAVLITPARTTQPADNDSSLALATTAFAKSQDAVLHREPDQAVALTAAASGSSGIIVADNANINFGTGNFALVWKGSLPDWTLSSTQYLCKKYDGASGYVIAGTGGGLYILLRGAFVTIINPIIAPPLFIDNTAHEFVFSFERETASIAGSLKVFSDGVLYATIAITAGSGENSNSTGALDWMGEPGTSRTAGTCIHAYTLNFAPTAAEVLDMYRNGIPEAWKWGSQTNLITGGTFTTDPGPWTKGATWTINTGDGKAVATNAISTDSIYQTNTLVIGKKYRATLVCSDFTSGSVAIRASAYAPDAYNAVFGPTITGVGTSSIEFTAVRTSDYIYAQVMSNDTTLKVSLISLVEIGATLALTPESWQSDKPYDCSSNNLVCAYPATGWSLTRRQKMIDDEAAAMSSKAPLDNPTFTLAITTPVAKITSLTDNFIPKHTSDAVGLENSWMKATAVNEFVNAAGTLTLAIGHSGFLSVASQHAGNGNYGTYTMYAVPGWLNGVFTGYAPVLVPIATVDGSWGPRTFTVTSDGSTVTFTNTSDGSCTVTLSWIGGL